MIPFERFKTPQDAYDWAKGATGTLLLVQQFRTKDHMVLKMNPATMSWDQELLSVRGAMVSTHEVREALVAIRQRIRKNEPKNMILVSFTPTSGIRK